MSEKESIVEGTRRVFGSQPSRDLTGTNDSFFLYRIGGAEAEGVSLQLSESK